MKNKLIPFFILLKLAFASIIPVFASPEFHNDALKIISNNQSYNFNIEIADTIKKRKIGLMNRRDLSLNSGMLFIYPSSKIVHMWMKNTYISLDVLFFSRSGKIIKIVTNTKPLDETPISSDERVLGFLELPAGTTKSLNIKTGSMIKHKLLNKEKQK